MTCLFLDFFLCRHTHTHFFHTKVRLLYKLWPAVFSRSIPTALLSFFFNGCTILLLGRTIIYLTFTCAWALVLFPVFCCCINSTVLSECPCAPSRCQSCCFCRTGSLGTRKSGFSQYCSSVFDFSNFSFIDDV